MKLVSLYIENFGGLSQYSLNFDAGVTMIQEPNGFGKTTLAEFIRAMFYGFPRKTKTLEKSKRQKYTPWNGGKCGGNLVFEAQGQQYRIERTFGATPKGDTFKLIDLATNKKSDRFSEEIGQELFQLDADSFERSTYMPQLQEGGSLTTNAIQAKLTRLVEDTGDINNFDKAMETLRGKRSAFVPYRGSGGSVAEARNQISRLQSQLDSAEQKRTELDRSHEEILQLEAALEEKHSALAAVRADITRASEAAAMAALRREYEQLLDQKQADMEALERLNETYPNGIPTPEELEQIQAVADRAAVLAGLETTTQADLDAKQYLEDNRARFEDRVPDAQELEAWRQQCSAYEALLTEIQSTGLSQQEAAQYERLRPLAEAGWLDAERIEQLAGQNRELVKLQHSLEAAAMTPEDARDLDALRNFFAAGVPEQAEIDDCRQELLSCQKLRQETEQLALRQPAAQKQTGLLPLILTLALGVLGIALGVVLLVGRSYLFGGIGLGIGVLALAIAIFLGVRIMVAREMGRSNAEIRNKIDANRAQILEKEQKIRNFTGRYVSDGDSAEALRAIGDKRSELLNLVRRQAAVQEKKDGLQMQIGQLEQQLRSALAPCFKTLPDFDKAIMELHLARGQFLDLQAEKAAAEVQTAALTEKAKTLCDELTSFLSAYYEHAVPERFGALLARLQQEGDAYLRAKAQVQAWEERRTRHEAETTKCEEALNRFFARYGVVRDGHIRRQLAQMRADGADLADIAARSEGLSQRLDALRAEGGEALTAPQSEDAPDLEQLKWQESRLNGEINLLTRQLLEQRQSRKELRAQVDKIPEIQDELTAWQEKKNEGQKKAQTLDDTMDFLQKARDSLSSSYLGPIRTSFSGYLKRLAGEEQAGILISPELEVQLERQGQARELAFFSAGQTDLIMLCMRLALVDALFTEEKPFVILDDPFVNLDDDRTAEALGLLQELSKDRQILYFTCNSSRGF